MVLTLVLPDWDVETWTWIGVVAYGLLSWLVLGPMCSRAAYRWEYRTAGAWCANDSATPVLIFMFAPIAWVIFALVYIIAHTVNFKGFLYGEPPAD